MLDPLFSRSVQEILTAILLERAEQWYLSDLARRLRRTPSTLQRPLEALVRAGIIRKRSDGNRIYFGADPDCTILGELRSMLEKTVAFVGVLDRVLRPHTGSIDVAFVYGSVAKGQDRSGSDIDLMIVGQVTLSDISEALSRAEDQLGRPINATILPPRELARKFAAKSHFLRSVLASEKIFVLGTADELEKLANPRPRRAARHQPKRTGRVAGSHRKKPQ
jgi:predicted nucleotidyltransferase